MPDVRDLRKLINSKPVVAAPTVVMDTTRGVFCDPSGLHMLPRAHKRCVSEGGELRMVVPWTTPSPGS